jgi:hypothetical protein
MDRNGVASAAKLAVNWVPAEVPARLRAMFPNATPAELQFVADIAALAIGIDLINRGIPKESVAPMPRYSLIARIQARIVVIAQLARLHAFHTAMLASDLAMLVPLPR